MPITYNEEKKIFHLFNEQTSYIFSIFYDKYLVHCYWGKRVKDDDMLYHAKYYGTGMAPNPVDENPFFSLDSLTREYPGYGNSDMRNPAYHIELENGSTVIDLGYDSHRIRGGKPKLQGLPAAYVESEGEADTLEIDLIDSLIGLKVTLIYSVFNDYNAITRSVKFTNMGKETLKIHKALSANVDFSSADYEMLHLSGAWARECQVIRKPLTAGTQSIESARGTSSPQHNPFLAMLSSGTDETNGEAYGFSLVYSGNFVAQAEVNHHDITRVNIGINPFDFLWNLKPHDSFQTPEVVMVYSYQGIGGMSRIYHRLYRDRLCRGKYRDKLRPILINSWEAVYFDFNESTLLSLCKKSASIGIELFVLDDGWFGKRNDDTSSLGDWYVNKDKLPGGLKGLAEKVQENGMKFGLWVEPEMVSPDSELYREHPDWCIHVPNRKRTTGRSQLVLDFSRDDVCIAVLKMLGNILSTVPISYIKWDMNRHLSEIGSANLPPNQQRETAHRYILGVYNVLEKLTSAYPHVLFESCSAGGGRFDPAMLHYMPQTWTSDNTDAVQRLKIQHGTSIVYPASSIGAHVSAVPNHQTGRVTDLKFRNDVAMSGNFGYELDIRSLSDSEIKEVSYQIEMYKEIRDLVQFGDLYRLKDPFGDKDSSLLYVSSNTKRAVLFYFSVHTSCRYQHKLIKLVGLNPDVIYDVNELMYVQQDYEPSMIDQISMMTCDKRKSYYGDQLMHGGFQVPFKWGDFKSSVFLLKAHVEK